MRRSATAADDSAKGTAAPNILLVMVDDMRADDFACLPKVQRMVAARGTSVQRVTRTIHFAALLGRRR